MKFLRLHTNKQNLDQLEQTLAGLLVPVTPSQKFREQLKAQLDAAPNAPEILMTTRGTTPEKLTIISLASLFSVLMLAAAGVRTFVTILGAIGLANELGKHMKTKKGQTFSQSI